MFVVICSVQRICPKQHGFADPQRLTDTMSARPDADDGNGLGLTRLYRVRRNDAPVWVDRSGWQRGRTSRQPNPSPLKMGRSRSRLRPWYPNFGRNQEGYSSAFSLIRVKFDLKLVKSVGFRTPRENTLNQSFSISMTIYIVSSRQRR